MKIVRNSIITIFLSIFLINCKKTPETKQWVAVFNGVDLDNWAVKIRGQELGVNWKNTFSVVDSVIKVDYSNYDVFDSSFGHLFYKTSFSNYKLKLK